MIYQTKELETKLKDEQSQEAVLLQQNAILLEPPRVASD
ncbi:hypothetical protein AALP_AA2G050400 [Arabis alpina]|uniref:Uncharacterized protein n=1 Tax=Arabis alpina TaxID=50452 RepID=A0A087HFF3_ARAAL|nr:hypothetical protein AALP_AA2G050400 [Arabis alpina]